METVVWNWSPAVFGARCGTRSPKPRSTIPTLFDCCEDCWVTLGVRASCIHYNAGQASHSRGLSFDSGYHSDEASPPQQPHEMESGGAGTHVVSAIRQPHTHRSFSNGADQVTLVHDPISGLRTQSPSEITHTNNAYFTSPTSAAYSSHVPVSNSRGYADEQAGQANVQQASPTANIVEVMRTSDAAPLGNGSLWDTLQLNDVKSIDSFEAAKILGPSYTDFFDKTASVEPDPKEMRGYAQLVFPDGEYLVTTLELVLGRHEQALALIKREQKRAAKAQRDAARREAEEEAAQEALEQYKQEPSQPSQRGEDDAQEPSSQESKSLEGRPAAGLPSNFSLDGGIVTYNGEDLDTQSRSRKRKRGSKQLYSQSSSTTSVAPAHLHTIAMRDLSSNHFDEVALGSAEHPKSHFLSVHPKNSEDVKGISKQHLRIYYNWEDKQWEMEVLGTNGAFVQNEEHWYVTTDRETGEEVVEAKHFKKGEVVVLRHETEVIISTTGFTFKLPQRRTKALSLSTFDSDADLDDVEDDEEEDEENNIGTSPARRLSNAMEMDEDDGNEDEGEDEESTQPELAKASQRKLKPHTAGKRPSLARKKPIKLHLKKRKEVTPPEKVPSPEAIRKPSTAGKSILGKKPKKAALSSEEVQSQWKLPEPKLISPEAPTEPPLAPINVQPGSVLHGLAPEELPQKRKGPGRPPKNGLVSKRDESIVKRKQREYEKRGELPPVFSVLLDMVRAENKQKEMVSKAAARGEPLPQSTLPVMQSIEVDHSAAAPAVPAPAPSADAPDQPSATPAELLERGAMSPKRQRAYRSPSPMKPLEHCTEEELKKPSQTYYTTLDEILNEGPEDGMELQQIYDKICKKYPYYKYKSETSGWQSSVRHNLKQHDRFAQAQKQGKGWLWAIDTKIPFDKEKKRKPTPPPRVMPQYPIHNGLQNGQMGQYAAPGFPQGYGQPGMNGQPPFQQQPQFGPNGQAYSSPYGQAGGYGVHGGYGPPSAGASGAPFAPSADQGPNASHPHPPTCTSLHHQPPFQQPHVLPLVASSQHHPQQPPLARPIPPQNQPEFSSLVEQIMAYRTRYLQPYIKQGQQTPEYQIHEDIFKKCTEIISDMHQGVSPETRFANEEERKVFEVLKGIMLRHQQRKDANGGSTPAPGQGAGPAGAQAPLQVQDGTRDVHGQNQGLRELYGGEPGAQMENGLTGAAATTTMTAVPVPGSRAHGDLKPTGSPAQQVQAQQSQADSATTVAPAQAEPSMPSFMSPPRPNSKFNHIDPQPSTSSLAPAGPIGHSTSIDTSISGYKRGVQEDMELEEHDAKRVKP